VYAKQDFINMSIKLNNEVKELKKRVEELEKLVAALTAKKTPKKVAANG